MIMFLKIKKKIKNKVCFDRWYDTEILVHYNYYLNVIEIKKLENNSFILLYDCKIKPFMKVSAKYIQYFNFAFREGI